jgi:hypothetical protein
MKTPFNLSPLLAKYTSNIVKEGAVLIFQVGSSLKATDFLRGLSDVDFLAVYLEEQKQGLSMDFDEKSGVETNVIKRSVGQFEAAASTGSSVELSAVYFGRVLFDADAYFEKFKLFKPSVETAHKLVEAGSRNFSVASIDMPPTTPYDFLKELHHAAKNFARALILKRLDQFVDGNTEILKHLKIMDKGLANDFRRIVNYRKRFSNASPLFGERGSIGKGWYGEAFLAVERLMKAAYLEVDGLKLEFINDLIRKARLKLGGKTSFNGVWFDETTKEVALSVIAKNEVKTLRFLIPEK